MSAEFNVEAIEKVISRNIVIGSPALLAAARLFYAKPGKFSSRKVFPAKSGINERRRVANQAQFTFPTASLDPIRGDHK